MADVTTARIDALQPGHSCGYRDNSAFAQVNRSEDGSTLTVDCGWVVPEADEDDYSSSSYHPFRDGRPRPWCGRRRSAASAEDALAVLHEFRTVVWGTDPTRATGERIGSVHRG